MIHLWLRALTQKFLGGRRLRRGSCPARRRSLRPRIDTLEDRTATSNMAIKPPVELPTPPTADLPAAVQKTDEDPSDPDWAEYQRGGRMGPTDPGWDKLLEDVRDPPSSTGPSQSPFGSQWPGHVQGPATPGAD